jgi:hypothetical protein
VQATLAVEVELAIATSENASLDAPLIVMAQEYTARADVTEAESKSPPAATVIQSVSPDRKTDEC